MERANVDHALSGPRHPGQPVLPGVVCTEALSPAPDNLLGAGDTSIMVLPYLEVSPDDTTSSSLPPKPGTRAHLAASPDLALRQGSLPYMTPPGNSKDSYLWTCGQLSTDSKW